jgi:hypothetical protein
MCGIALDPGGSPVLNGDQHSTSIRAIVRAGGMNDFLHDLLIITVDWMVRTQELGKPLPEINDRKNREQQTPE